MEGSALRTGGSVDEVENQHSAVQDKVEDEHSALDEGGLTELGIGTHQPPGTLPVSHLQSYLVRPGISFTNQDVFFAPPKVCHELVHGVSARNHILPPGIRRVLKNILSPLI